MSAALTGRTIRLTPLRDADVEPLFEWINDRELVLQSAPFRPVDEAGHRAWFDEVRKRADVAIFAIRPLDGDRLIGTCQLLAIDTRHRTAELQIRIGEEDDRGRGVGTEAVRLLVWHAFRDLDLRRVQLHAFATNQAAIRAYEKAGFRREGVLREGALIDERRLDIVVMGILRSEVSDE